MSRAKDLIGRLQRAGAAPILVSFVVLAILLVVYGSVSAGGFSSFALENLATATATLAIMAVGEAIVIISGGFDFSPVALLALLNVFLVSQAEHLGGSYLLTAIIVILIATFVGAVNGVLVGFLRVQPIIATIATFFILSGGALALMESPGGSVPATFSDVFTGTWGSLPAGAGVVVIAGLLWTLIRQLRFGRYLKAVGSDAAAAFARGVPVRGTLVATYAIAGTFYGIASLTYTAAIASGDPRVNFVMLVQVFAAVVVGGIALGGGRGEVIGAIVGALCLTLLESILFAVGLESYYTPVVFGLVLLVVVLPGSIGGDVMEAIRRSRARPRRKVVETIGDEA